MRDQIIDIMASVFGVDRKEVAGGVVFGKFSQWDSLRHMTLVVALEEEFNVTFDEEEVTDMLSLDLIVEILLNKK
jgi:acyl carrier protein